jgi:hypothetical protein
MKIGDTADQQKSLQALADAWPEVCSRQFAEIELTPEKMAIIEAELKRMNEKARLFASSVEVDEALRVVVRTETERRPYAHPIEAMTELAGDPFMKIWAEKGGLD